MLRFHEFCEDFVWFVIASQPPARTAPIRRFGGPRPRHGRAIDAFEAQPAARTCATGRARRPRRRHPQPTRPQRLSAQPQRSCVASLRQCSKWRGPGAQNLVNCVLKMRGIRMRRTITSRPRPRGRAADRVLAGCRTAAGASARAGGAAEAGGLAGYVHDLGLDPRRTSSGPSLVRRCVTAAWTPAISTSPKSRTTRSTKAVLKMFAAQAAAALANAHTHGAECRTRGTWKR